MVSSDRRRGLPRRCSPSISRLAAARRPGSACTRCQKPAWAVLPRHRPHPHNRSAPRSRRRSAAEPAARAPSRSCSNRARCHRNPARSAIRLRGGSSRLSPPAFIADYNVVLLPGEKPGNAVTFQYWWPRRQLPRLGRHSALAQLWLCEAVADGRPIGDPCRYGARHLRLTWWTSRHVCLDAGSHRLRFRFCGRYLVGISWLGRSCRRPAAPPATLSSCSTRSPCAVAGAASQMALGVHVRRAGRDEYVLAPARREAVLPSASGGDLTGVARWSCCPADGRLSPRHPWSVGRVRGRARPGTVPGPLSRHGHGD